MYLKNTFLDIKLPDQSNPRKKEFPTVLMMLLYLYYLTAIVHLLGNIR